MRLYGLSERFGRYLEPAQGKQLHDTGIAFCKRYVALVSRAVKHLVLNFLQCSWDVLIFLVHAGTAETSCDYGQRCMRLGFRCC